MTKCSKKQRDRAVDLYIRYERCAADVIRELGYPGKGVLLSWCADRFEEECTGVPSGRSERYRRYGDGRKRVAVEHYLEYGGGSAAPCGCLAIRKVRLHFVREPHTVVRAIAQEPLEVRQILRCADDQDVTDPGHHQHTQRIVDHRIFFTNLCSSPITQLIQILQRDRPINMQLRIGEVHERVRLLLLQVRCAFTRYVYTAPSSNP